MFKQLQKFLVYFGRGYLKAAFGVLIGCFISALFELVGVILIFPLMGLVVQPEATLQNRFMSSLYIFFGSPKIAVFVVFLSVGIGAIYIVKALFQVLFLRLEHRFLSQWKTNICYRLFQRYLEVDYSFHLQRSSSEIIGTITNDVSYVINHYLQHYILLASNAIVSLGLVCFLAYQYTSVTFGVVVIFSILFFAQSRLIRMKMSALGKEMSDSSTQNYSALQQGIAAYKETKINIKERFFCLLFARANKKRMDVEGKLLFFQYLPIITTEIIVILTLIIAFDMLMIAPNTRAAVTIDIAVLVMVVFRMVPLVNRAITSLGLIQSAQDTLNKLFDEADLIGYKDAVEVDQIPDENSAPPLILTDALVLDKVSYTYPSADHPALNDVFLKITKGDFVGIIGPSGAGKTTLIGILLGFLKPSIGTFCIDQTRITPDNLRSLRQTIGYVDQQAFIFDVSIMENVAFGIPFDQIDRDRVEEALRLSDLWDFVSSLEKGMESGVGENGKRLSGGQRQRLAIARALYKRPSILILDEATSSLDMETEHRISSAIGKLKGKMTIIAIAHRLSTLRACNRLIIMQDGKIGQEGTYDVLLATNPQFQELVRISQLKQRTE